MSKYRADNLLPALRLFAAARAEALAAGFTDNGGAIHSVERILDILGQRIRYPHLSHINKLKLDAAAERSAGAARALLAGEPVFIEHVMPQRAFAQEACRLIGEGATDEEVLAYIAATYRLVLLDAGETAALNRANRSRLTPDRIADAGIELHREPDPGA